MTIQEAIEELKYDCSELGKAIPCDTGWGVAINSAYGMAIEALEKQIPQKVIGKKMFPGNCGELHLPNFSGKCPSCGHELIRGVSAHKGCPYCLQVLDWS